MVTLERSWLAATLMKDLTDVQRREVRALHQEIWEEREAAANLPSSDWASLNQRATGLRTMLIQNLGKVLPEAELQQYQSLDRQMDPAKHQQSARHRTAQGDFPCIITDPESKQTELFDFVHITRRSSGYKVRLHKDRPWRDLTAINVILERDVRNVFCEPLAYTFHR